MVREAKKQDLMNLLELYLHLHETRIPEQDSRLDAVWDSIISDKNHHVIINEVDGKIVSSCVCVIIPNLTRDLRPYALVENVVTHADYRKMGYAGQCLDYAKKIAEREDCTRLMLMTGSKKPETHKFYENAGYNSEDKTAFVQWLGAPVKRNKHN